MHNTFQLDIITPSGKVVECSAHYLEIRTPEGSLDILAHHEAMLAKLADGEICYRQSYAEHEDTELTRYRVQDAYFSFLGNTATIISAI